jgi:hypothetical protein
LRILLPENVQKFRKSRPWKSTIREIIGRKIPWKRAPNIAKGFYIGSPDLSVIPIVSGAIWMGFCPEHVSYRVRAFKHIGYRAQKIRIANAKDLPKRCEVVLAWWVFSRRHYFNCNASCCPNQVCSFALPLAALSVCFAFRH